MKKGWMVRAGEGGRLFEEFEKGYVAVGWNDMGDIGMLSTREQLAAAYVAAYPNSKEATRPNQIAMIDKFRNGIQKGDVAIRTTLSPVSI